MKFLKIMTMLLIGILHAESSFEHPPILSNTVSDVISHGWKRSDAELNKYFENRSEGFFSKIKNILETPLVEKTDDEYISEQILAINNSDIDPEVYGLPPRVSEEEYLKMLKMSIQYNIKYDAYKNRIEIEDFKYIFVYIKWLEQIKQFDDSYTLYILILEKYQYIDRLVKHNSINGIKKIVLNDFFKRSINESLLHNHYTNIQKKKIYTMLSKVLMINEDYWDDTVQEEKRVSLANTKMALIDEKDFEKFINKIHIERDIFNDIDKQTLKKYFEDKKLMQKVLNSYEKKLDILIEETKRVTDHEAYLELEKAYKKKTIQYFDLLKEKVGTNKRYKPSIDKFIDAATFGIFGYNQVWRIGRSKRDYLETIKTNVKYLQDLKEKL